MKKGVDMFIILLLISFPIVSALSYTYDANGNRISDDGFYREYDSSNHLVNVYTGSEPLIANLVENYTWSLTEERVVAKYVYYNRTLNESVYYPYENWVRVVNSSGSFDFYYVIQNSEVVAMQDYAGHKFYYHNDHKGSVQLVTNENGSAVERTFYEPFGAVVSGGSKTRFDYEGEEFDSVTGDYDFDARRFDSSNNQFIQPDSVIQNVYDPQSLNHYSFERNNPYKYEDENGHNPVVVIGIGAAVGGGWNVGRYVYNNYEKTSTNDLFRGGLITFAGGAFGGAAVTASIFTGSIGVISVAGGTGSGIAHASMNLAEGKPWSENVAFSAFIGAITTPLIGYGISSQLPIARTWLISNPSSYATTKTGATYIANAIITEAISQKFGDTITDKVLQQGKSSASGPQNSNSEYGACYVPEKTLSSYARGSR